MALTGGVRVGYPVWVTAPGHSTRLVSLLQLPLGNIADVDLSWFPEPIVRDIFETEALERRISGWW